MGTEVRVLLIRRGLRQEDLARVLGISTGSMSHRLNGRTGFSVDELGTLAEFFDVEPADLLGARSGDTPRYVANVIPLHVRTIPPLPLPERDAEVTDLARERAARRCRLGAAA